MRARYYDAGLGRLISRDPIGMRDNVNLYTYVANSPLNFKDILGLSAKALIFVWKDWGSAWPLSLLKTYQKYKYLAMWYKEENISIQSGWDINTFIQDIWAGSYKDIAIVSHATTSSVQLTYGWNGNQLIDNNTVSQLPVLNDKNITLTIDGCMSGYGDHPIAEVIASQMWITVKAPDSLLRVTEPITNHIWLTNDSPTLESAWTYTKQDIGNLAESWWESSLGPVGYLAGLLTGGANCFFVQSISTWVSWNPANFLTF